MSLPQLAATPGPRFGVFDLPVLGSEVAVRKFFRPNERAEPKTSEMNGRAPLRYAVERQSLPMELGSWCRMEIASTRRSRDAKTDDRTRQKGTRCDGGE